MNRQLRADMMLVLVTLFWGVSYLLMDTALEDLEPFTLNFIRFFGAFVIAAAAFFPKIRNVNKITLMYSALIGLILVFVYIGATFGVMYTSLSNAGFLCALTCVFTLVLGLIFKKQIPDKKFIFVIVI
ncbi:MAG: EamA family transporter [Anaerovoracaceae bacterium]|nr:EamA family transporter [Anaerovoracaceae bacterium]